MEEISTHVSPSSDQLEDIISIKEENETKSGANISENQCDLCGKILSSKKNLKKHYKLHSNIRNYVCTICNKSYKRSDHLRRHMITHNPEPNYYECDYCLKRFSLNYHLTAHIQSVHSNNKLKVYQCPDCDLCFNKKSKLFLHQKDIHNLVSEKIPCYYPYCNKSYISEEKLNYHIQKFHMNLINNQNNNNSDNIFSDNTNNIFNDTNEENNIEIKSENSSNKEKKYYKCPYKECLKVYSSYYNLSVHIKTFHLKIKSFCCTICPNKYYHKVSLKKHLMIEHKFNNEQLKKYWEDSGKHSDNIKAQVVIEEVKKNFIDEGLYQNSCGENEVTANENNNEEQSYNSRIISDEASNERKNNEYFLEEFHNNMIEEINFLNKKIGSEEAN
jgi:hypothetical protein